jgi:large subunit ribosomal protein L3
MVEGLLGRKVGMSQAFESDGTWVPVTLLEVGPCVVVQPKSDHGTVQIGLLEPRRAKRQSKAKTGHLKRWSTEPGVGLIREFKLVGAESPTPGTKLDVSILGGFDRVDVRGVSKGKGFQGVVRRHHFRGGRASHGSMFHRAPGSIGASSFPSRVVKGMRAAGHMGLDRVTSRNLKVVQVDPTRNLVAVRGAVPGPAGGYVEVRRAKSLRGK